MFLDTYFLRMCNTVSTNSKCLSRQIGAVIVKDKTVLSMGYNGPPRGVPHCNERYLCDENLQDLFIQKNIKMDKSIEHTCPRKILGFKSGEGLEWCIAGHAEENAIINAAREGISVKGATMYCNCPVPCSNCLIKIINAGIEKIVVTDFEYYDIMSKWLVNKSGITLSLYQEVFCAKGY